MCAANYKLRVPRSGFGGTRRPAPRPAGRRGFRRGGLVGQPRVDIGWLWGPASSIRRADSWPC